MRPLALLIPMMLLAACDRSGDAKSPPVATATASVAGSPATDVPPAAPASARKVSEANDVYEFDYAYPAAAAAIPALKAILDGDLDMQKAALSKQAGEDKKEAEKQGFPIAPTAGGRNGRW